MLHGLFSLVIIYILWFKLYLKYSIIPDYPLLLIVLIIPSLDMTYEALCVTRR
jgi:hypothetical protein